MSNIFINIFFYFFENAYLKSKKKKKKIMCSRIKLFLLRKYVLKMSL